MSEFDTERFIIELEQRSAVWDFESPDYANKHLKNKEWEEVCVAMYPEYEGIEAAKKWNKCKILQRRWRSLRDCYTRELNAQLKLKSGSARPDRKHYVYFNQLSFLRHSVEKRKTASSLDEKNSQMIDTVTEDGGDIGDGEFSGMQQVEDVAQQPESQPPQDNEPMPPENIRVRSSSVTSRKRTHDQLLATEIKLLQDMSKRLAQKSTEAAKPSIELEEDEDRLSLMSLLKDVKKVHPDDRLELKSEMILLVKKWQRARTSFTQNHQYSNDALTHQSYGSSLSHASTPFQTLSQMAKVQSPTFTHLTSASSYSSRYFGQLLT